MQLFQDLRAIFAHSAQDMEYIWRKRLFLIVLILSLFCVVRYGGSVVEDVAGMREIFYFSRDLPT